MSWIKIENITLDKPEVGRIATALRADRFAVFGRLVHIWTYFDLHSIDGTLRGIDFAFLDSIVNRKGFCAAMARVGWLQHGNEGDTPWVSLPHFDRHNGQTAKDRALHGKRQQKYRNTEKTSVSANFVTDEVTVKRHQSDGQSDGGPSQSASPDKRREDKSREEKSFFGSKKPETEIPPTLNTPEFLRTWDEWISYRRENKFPAGKQTIKTQLEQLADYGPLMPSPLSNRRFPAA